MSKREKYPIFFPLAGGILSDIFPFRFFKEPRTGQLKIAAFWAKK